MSVPSLLIESTIQIQQTNLDTLSFLDRLVHKTNSHDTQVTDIDKLHAHSFI